MGWIWTQRTPTKILVLVLVMTLVAPHPPRVNSSIRRDRNRDQGDQTAIRNVIGAGLRDINIALKAVNRILNSIQSFFQNAIYPQDAITRARGVVGAVQGIYNLIRGVCKSQRG